MKRSVIGCWDVDAAGAWLPVPQAARSAAEPPVSAAAPRCNTWRRDVGALRSWRGSAATRLAFMALLQRVPHAQTRPEWSAWPGSALLQQTLDLRLDRGH